MLRVVCWNVARRRRPLADLLAMDADVGLLQEVGTGAASGLPAGMETGGRRHWDSFTWASDHPEDSFRTWCNRWPMVVRLSDRVEVEWFDEAGPGRDPDENELSVSDVGLIAAARVMPRVPRHGEPFIAASLYAHWNRRTARPGPHAASRPTSGRSSNATLPSPIASWRRATSTRGTVQGRSATCCPWSRSIP